MKQILKRFSINNQFLKTKEIKKSETTVGTETFTNNQDDIEN